MSEQQSAPEPLTPRERRVLELAAGLVDGQQRTVAQIANRFGVTEERIQQILRSAHRKLAPPLP